MSFVGEAEKERNDLTPAEGWNVCIYDEFGRFGENLDVAQFVNTQAEARQAKAALEMAGSPKVYILGQRDKIDELATTETVSIPSGLSNQDVLAKTRYRETEYPYDVQHIKNYVATGNKVDSQPSMHGEEGFVSSKQIPEWPFDIESYRPQIHEALRIQEARRPRPTNVPPATVSRFAKYMRTAHDYDDICAQYEGSIYDLKDEAKRPVPPSEGLGYTTTHPNCKCYWQPMPDYKGEATQFSLYEKDYNKHIRQLIGQRARHHTLHTTWQDGKLSKRTRGTSPLKEIELRPIRETVTGLKMEFGWFSEDYMQRLAKLKSDVGGEFFLIRASGETVTDHRAEGDPYRRLLTADEIHSMARTGIHKGTDVNHLKQFQTQGIVMDADYNPINKTMEMLIHERDPAIIAAVQNGLINEVSINGGLPRSQDIECNSGECYVVPRGVVLGEMDNIALTYVVNDPAGLWYKGQWLEPKKAGVKTTAIEIL